MNSEPYALRTATGLEITSNDRRLKYILRKSVSYTGAMEQEYYLAYCYVREGTGWERTDSVGVYNDEAEFLETLLHAPEFTRASKELKP